VGLGWLEGRDGDGRPWLVSGDGKGTILLWQPGAAPLSGFQNTTDGLTLLRVSPARDLLAVGCSSGRVLILALEGASGSGLRIVSELRGHVGTVQSLSWHLGKLRVSLCVWRGESILGASVDLRLFCVTVARGPRARGLDVVWSLACSGPGSGFSQPRYSSSPPTPGKSALVSAGADRTVRFWEAEAGGSQAFEAVRTWPLRPSGKGRQQAAGRDKPWTSVLCTPEGMVIASLAG
jgi:WD40 repeat protein